MFKRLFVLLLLSIVILLLTACGGEESEPTKQAEQVEYEVVMDEKFKKTEQREIRVTTDLSEEEDFNAITEDIMSQYKDKELDSIHLYIHAPDGDNFGVLKAHSFIAYTQKGVVQTGLKEANSYKVEIEEQQGQAENRDANDQSSEEWQASFRQIALSEAERYVELTEREGDLLADRLEEHSGVIQQQADKLVIEEEKQAFTELATLVKENKLDEVKAKIGELKQ